MGGGGASKIWRTAPTDQVSSIEMQYLSVCRPRAHTKRPNSTARASAPSACCHGHTSSTARAAVRFTITGVIANIPAAVTRVLGQPFPGVCLSRRPPDTSFISEPLTDKLERQTRAHRARGFARSMILRVDNDVTA